jgi:hypothetical protein
MWSSNPNPVRTMKNPSAKVLGGGLVLALALLLPSLTGEAAPLPPPKKMTLPPTASFFLNRLQSILQENLDRFNRKPEERELIPYARYDYYYNCILCLRNHLDGGPRWKMDRPLTTEERRGLRDMLQRLERELKEGQANGTVGDEELPIARQRFRNKSTKK